MANHGNVSTEEQILGVIKWQERARIVSCGKFPDFGMNRELCNNWGIWCCVWVK
jgi:hypothetical protein